MIYLNTVLLRLFTIILFLPTVTLGLKLVPLHGVEHQVEFPELSLANLKKRDFQEQFNKWFAVSIGLRDVLIKSDNQLNFSLFKLLPNSIIVGKNNFLFERVYINELNQVIPVKEEKLNVLIGKLKKFQTKLESRKIPFILLISPNKAKFLSSFVPQRYVVPGNKSNHHEFFLTKLEQKKINYIDSQQFLNSIQPEISFPIFPKGGVHWTQVAACHVAERIILRFEELSKTNLRNLNCTDLEETLQPRGSDQDLATLANIWTTKKFFDAKYFYPRKTETITGSKVIPKMLFVGTSFTSNLLFYYDRLELYKERDFLYYFKRLNSWPEETSTTIDRTKIDWSNILLNSDLVLIEINQLKLQEVGFGFIEAALEQL